MMMHDICTFFCLHEGADVVVPYEVPDNLSVAWYFGIFLFYMMLDICLNHIPNDGTVWGENKFVGQ